MSSRNVTPENTSVVIFATNCSSTTLGSAKGDNSTIFSSKFD